MNCASEVDDSASNRPHFAKPTKRGRRPGPPEAYDPYVTPSHGWVYPLSGTVSTIRSLESDQEGDYQGSDILQVLIIGSSRSLLILAKYDVYDDKLLSTSEGSSHIAPKITSKWSSVQ